MYRSSLYIYIKYIFIFPKYRITLLASLLILLSYTEYSSLCATNEVDFSHLQLLHSFSSFLCFIHATIYSHIYDIQYACSFEGHCMPAVCYVQHYPADYTP